MTRKAKFERRKEHVIKMRSFKNFSRRELSRIIAQMPWTNTDNFDNDPNNMWEQWKTMFLKCVNAHVPLITKRVRGKISMADKGVNTTNASKRLY